MRATEEEVGVGDDVRQLGMTGGGTLSVDERRQRQRGQKTNNRENVLLSDTLLIVQLKDSDPLFSSVQFKMVSLCSEKPIINMHSTLGGFPNIAFETVPMSV